MAEHQEQPDLEEVEAVEDDGILFSIKGAILVEFVRHFRVMHTRLEVVDDVIPIVEAASIVASVDARNATFEVVVWFLGINERVLAPVAGHHEGTHEDNGKDEHDERCLKTDHCGKKHADCPKGEFTEKQLSHHFLALAPLVVPGEIDQAEDHEPAPIVKPMCESIALVGHRGREISKKVTLFVMHSHMMHEVGIGSLTEHGPNEPRDDVIKIFVATIEKRPMGRAMEHQGKTIEPRREQDGVAGSEPPAEAARPKEIKGGGPHG